MTRPQAVQPLASYSNYFLGPDPKKWHIGVRHYGRILYTNAYPGIDLVYFFDKNGDLTYELYVKPGADPSSIELTYEAIDGVESGNDSAHMNILSANGCLHDGALRCYQEIGPKRIPVASAFEKTGSSSYSVVLLEPYDESRTLVIDPPLAFSTYWGSGTAVNRTVVVDTQGNIYMSGGTSSTTWPTTPGVYQTTHSGTSWPDVTTAKFDSDGQLIWSTFLGGPFEDYAYVSAVNANGELYISGRSGDGFPTTPGSFDTTFNGGYFQGSVHAPTDAFVVKLSADATQLLYSTYIGGNGNDNGRSIHLLPSGHLLIGGGNTTSTDLPTTAGVLKPNRGGGKDSWVAKVIPDGSDLDFCTYFGPNNDSGGSGDEIIRALGIDASGNTWIGGSTHGSDMIPTAGAFQSVRGSALGTAESYIAKISADATSLIYFSWLGGNNFDEIETEGVSDTEGNFYVSGGTSSTDFPVTAGAFQTTLKGGWDAFVARINNDGSLGFATFYGGSTSGPEAFFGPVVDQARNVYCTGRFRSTDCSVTADAFQPTKAGPPNVQDAVLTIFSPDGSNLLYGSYFGGSDTEYGRHIGIAPDDSAVYIIGETQSTDMPTINAYQTTPAGAFLVKFALGPPVIADVIPNPDSVFAGSEYVKQLNLLQGTPLIGWSLLQKPTGSQIDSSGLVSGWIPVSGDIGTSFDFQVQATNSLGSDIENWQVMVKSLADYNNDNDVDQEDFGHFQECMTGHGNPQTDPACLNTRLDGDVDVDLDDFQLFQSCMNGANQVPNC
ncbi:MAG: DUF7948 domain-containing protein [Planctomycetota bacterium]|jgi:hypothetical protein